MNLELDKRFDDVCDFLLAAENNKDIKSMDTLLFRKKIEQLELINKVEIVNYVEKYLLQSPAEYKILKRIIDDSEFTSDYYRNFITKFNKKRKFIGSTRKVICRTFAGMMLI